MKSLQDFLRLALAVLVVGLTVGYALAAWQLPQQGPPAGPGGYNADAPINVSNTAQTKDGSLTISDNLFSSKILAINKLGVGSIFTNPNQLDATAVLDVNGLIRLRSGCPLGINCTNKILISSNADGLATWADPLSVILLFGLEAGFGIVPGAGSPGMAMDADSKVHVATTTQIQARITGVCGNDSAITTVKQDGAVDCLPLVSSLTDTPVGGSGLSISNTAGAVTLSVNTAGGGLAASGNLLKVNPPAAGSGLLLSGGSLKFDTTNCSGANVYWKYVTGTGWTCSASPTGGTIMYLSSLGTPPNCPTSPSPDWVELGVSKEYVTAFGYSTNTRICRWNRNNPVCRVMYLTQVTPTTPPACPSDWTSHRVETVVAPGSPQTILYYNQVRTCYKCN